ncbi:MAG TPA: hypothetical protein VFT99_14905 [Roseiflexaceae bacterium]|nr:hypothetical protein [Roseiflexaceae bacterium]
MSLIAGNLGVIQRLLDTEQITWAICAGAAAHLYGNRRPIQDVDILVAKGKLPDVVKLLQSQNRVVQFDGQRILWRGMKIFDDLSIRRGTVTHSFAFDGLMRERLRRMSLLGTLVPVLAPEDVLIHKMALNRGADQGKHDHEDAAGIARRQQLDSEYIAQRLQMMQLPESLLAALPIVSIAG